MYYRLSVCFFRRTVCIIYINVTVEVSTILIGGGIVRFYLWGVCGGGLVGAGDLLRNVKGWGGEFRGGGSFFEGGGFFFGGDDGCAVFFCRGGGVLAGLAGFVVYVA